MPSVRVREDLVDRGFFAAAPDQLWGAHMPICARGRLVQGTGPPVGCVRSISRWLLRNPVGRRGPGGGAVGGGNDDRSLERPGRPDQAVIGAVVCLWSLSRLWVAVISRHSERQADLPRRKKRSQRRLNFVWAKTGSIIVWRCA